MTGTSLAELYGTGCRISEALRLEWRTDIDMVSSPPRIRLFGKGSRARVIAMSELVHRALLNQRALLRGMGVSTSYVFPHRIGDKGRYWTGKSDLLDPNQPSHRCGLRRRWRKRFHDIGMDRIAFHYLRHTFATENAPKSIKDTSEILGHSSITVTAMYLHPDFQRQIAIVNEYGSEFLKSG